MDLSRHGPPCGIAAAALAASMTSGTAYADVADTTFIAWSPRTTSADAGETTDALPGLGRVPLAGPIARTGFALASSAGYGWTESVLGQGDSHQRATGSLAASFRPVPFFAAAVRFDGRYDWSTGAETTNGGIGDPRVEFRVGAPIGRAFAIGAQLGVWFPGGGAPSWVFKATTPDASGILTYQAPDSPVILTTRVGFRWDNSAESAPDAARLALPDRLELGLNQASAMLLALGAAVRVSPRVEVLADATWDLLVGDGAPTATDDPIVVSAGARVGLDRAGTWQLEVLATASPSGRPVVSATSPLVDIEPRLGGFAGLVVRPRLPGPPEPAPAPLQPVALPEPPPEPPPVAAVVRASVRGQVVSEGAEEPVAGAHLTLRTTGAPVREATADAQGNFEVDDLGPGPASVDVTADGFTPVTRALTLSASPVEVRLSIAKALPSGQVRGLVRDFSGNPVAAQIRVEPVGVDVKVGADGTFEANVAPGTYDVVIRAAGYADQKRHLVVERDGVTMLNVELRKGK